MPMRQLMTILAVTISIIVPGASILGCDDNGVDIAPLDVISVDLSTTDEAAPDVGGSEDAPTVDSNRCEPQCDGRECGDDGCGGACGDCGANSVCLYEGVCLCIPDCVGQLCGDDGCGGSCGECDDGQFCNDGMCSDTCVSDEGCTETGLTVCADEGEAVLECVEVSADCLHWSPATACPSETFCLEGVCEEWLCRPYSRICDETTMIVLECLADGSDYQEVQKCVEGETCIEGACVAEMCEPGDTACAGALLLTCSEDGVSWTKSECPGESVCYDGACLDCVFDEHCEEGKVCRQGVCANPILEVVTTTLPSAVVGTAYTTSLTARGGDGTMVWSTTGGALPAGIAMDQDGIISGTPTVSGDFTFSVQVADGSGQTANGNLTLAVISIGSSLVITTASPLPNATEGEEYSTTLAAEQGLPPYGWFIIDGALPNGLTLGSNGKISGIPDGSIGQANFKVRVVDADTPVGFASKDFALTVKVAPLEIVAETIYDLWLVKIVVLDMLISVEGIPLPYNQQLQAKGGIKPYVWSETQMTGISWLIPKAGIPQGLTLDSNGKLHGSVTDPSQVVSITIPFTQIKLTGFFFAAKVVDSNSPQDSDSGLFLIPTVPVSF